MVMLVGPFKMIFFNMLVSFYLWIYRLIFYRKYTKTDKDSFWMLPLTHACAIFDTLAKFFHAYEIDLNKIPSKGPAILILYHGITPCDLGMIFARVLLHKKRKVICLVDRMMFYVPGIKTSLEAIGAIAGTQKICEEMLRKGNLIAIYPGGTRESLFSSSDYNLIWQDRKGFAKLAIQTKAPIIPMFTKNSRQIHAQVKWGESFLRKIYDRKKIVFFVLYGWFPVKLKTYVADPIKYDKERSVEELVDMTKKSIENLIDTYQHRPASIWNAVIERFIEEIPTKL